MTAHECCIHLRLNTGTDRISLKFRYTCAHLVTCLYITCYRTDGRQSRPTSAHKLNVLILSDIIIIISSSELVLCFHLHVARSNASGAFQLCHVPYLLHATADSVCGLRINYMGICLVWFGFFLPIFYGEEEVTSRIIFVRFLIFVNSQMSHFAPAKSDWSSCFRRHCCRVLVYTSFSFRCDSRSNLEWAQTM